MLGNERNKIEPVSCPSILTYARCFPCPLRSYSIREDVLTSNFQEGGKHCFYANDSYLSTPSFFFPAAALDRGWRKQHKLHLIYRTSARHITTYFLCLHLFY